MRKERRGDERGGEGRKKRGRGGREPWINVLTLTCSSTGGDRGTANSVSSCSRQAAASLSSAQRSASFASEREPSAKIGARNKTTNVGYALNVRSPP